MEPGLPIGSSCTRVSGPGMASEVNHGPRPPYPSDETLVDLLVRHARDTPAAIALAVPEGEQTDGARLELSCA